MSGILFDLLAGGVGCLAVALLALAGVFRRLGRRGRVILSACLALLLMLACGATQLGAIRTALSQQASPSHATLAALSADSANLDTVTGLSGHDGSTLWRRPLGLYLVTGTVADNAIYLVGFAQPNQTQATLLAVRLSDGAPLWRMALPGQQTPSQLLVAGGVVIALVRTSVAPPAYELRAIDRFSHAVAWRVAIPDPSAYSGFDALATGAGLLFLGSQDGVVRALRLSDGGAAWSARITPSNTFPHTFPSLGVVARGATLIAYDTTGEVVSLRQSDGATLWGRQLPRSPGAYFEQQVTLTSGNLYACAYDPTTTIFALAALDPLTGATRWSHDVRGSSCAFSTPVESGGYVYALDSTLLTALRVSDGALVWRGQPEGGDLGYTTLQSDGGVVFAATTISNYRSISVCGQWFPPGVSLCHSTQYVAAFDGATGARYWRTTDSYIGLLGAG
jgi:PQQ-like domain